MPWGGNGIWGEQFPSGPLIPNVTPLTRPAAEAGRPADAARAPPLQLLGWRVEGRGSRVHRYPSQYGEAAWERHLLAQANSGLSAPELSPGRPIRPTCTPRTRNRGAPYPIVFCKPYPTAGGFLLEKSGKCAGRGRAAAATPTLLHPRAGRAVHGPESVSASSSAAPPS